MTLKPSEDTRRVVLVGGWNPRVFSPDWLKAQGFTSQEPIELEIAFGAGIGFSHRVKIDCGLLTVSESSVWIKSNDESIEGMTLVESAAISIMEKLVHTPLKAVGFNFDYSVNDPSPEIFQLFDIQTHQLIAENGKDIQKSQIVHNFSYSDEISEVLVQWNIEGSRVKVVVNFNFPVESCTAAIIALRGKSKQFSEISKEVLNWYGLNV